MTAQQECEELMNDILPLAIQMLEERGEFYPYGGKVTSEGEIIHVDVMDDDTDHPESNPLIETMTREFRDEGRTGTCRATAMVMDVKVVPPEETTKTDAIQVCLDHRDGYAVEVFFPYAIDRLRKIVIHPPFAQKGASRIFGPVN